MSELERNRGSLCYIGDADEIIPENLEEWEVYDFLEERGLMVIAGKVYTIAYNVKSERDCNYFAEISVDENDIIYFHTMHYNGGGSLEEVLECELRNRGLI